MTDRIFRQYGINNTNNKSTNNTNEKSKGEIENNKSISRQLGGLKGSGTNSVSVDIDGKLINLPKYEYVDLLEKQIRELRTLVQTLEKQLIQTNNRIQKILNKQINQ